jgi:CheY-like chemotaxis protein
VPKILVIDDEESFARAIHRVLRRVLPDAWDVHWEPAASTGLSLLVLDGLVRLCFVDIQLATGPEGMNGDELIEQALKLRPDMRGRIVVCSGRFLDARLVARLFGELECVRLDKPVDFARLQSLVWAVVHGGPMPP